MERGRESLICHVVSALPFGADCREAVKWQMVPDTETVPNRRGPRDAVGDITLKVDNDTCEISITVADAGGGIGRPTTPFWSGPCRDRTSLQIGRFLSRRGGDTGAGACPCDRCAEPVAAEPFENAPLGSAIIARAELEHGRKQGWGHGHPSRSARLRDGR